MSVLFIAVGFAAGTATGFFVAYGLILVGRFLQKARLNKLVEWVFGALVLAIFYFSLYLLFLGITIVLTEPLIYRKGWSVGIIPGFLIYLLLVRGSKCDPE